MWSRCFVHFCVTLRFLPFGWACMAGGLCSQLTFVASFLQALCLASASASVAQPIGLHC